ncbi:unnamed protein product [Leptidea sinapis]|uniref:Tudor domain-containing protein n=1 Tax=Leptidea sinapis TaxID=189913 RepID=A0A5E4QLG4_9NEOP|nr:unnamed protein product [Leptidea sinapis]
MWLGENDQSGLENQPVGKGQRLIVCHAGSAKTGLVPEEKLVFRAVKSKDASILFGNHQTEMDADTYMAWFKDFLRVLEEPSITVLDNASYHSKQLDPIPTMSWKKTLDRKAYGNIPLFLSCGHSMCETCVRNLVKFAEPIECKTCHQDMTLDVKELASLVENKVSLYDLFPINVYMLGELAKQYINDTVWSAMHLQLRCVNSEIGNSLQNMQNENETTDLTKLMNTIDQHYSKLTSQIDKQKADVTTLLCKLATAENDSLVKAKAEVENSIKKAAKFSNAVKQLDPNQLKKVNVSAILEDAKRLLEAPWYLNKGGSNDAINPFWRVNTQDNLKKYPKAQGIAEKPKIFISNNDFKQNSIEEVMITHIVSPDNFFIRKCHQQGVYEKLCADLEQEYYTHLQSNYIYLPEKSSVALLKRFENKSLELHVEDNRNRNSIGVTLYDKTDPDNELIYRFNDTDHTEQVYIKKSPKLTEKPTPKGNNKKKAVAATSKQSTDTEDDLKAKHKGPLRLEAKVLNCQSPSLIYVSLVQQQKTYNEMFDSIQKYYSKATDAQVKWNVGDRCVCLCIQSKTWRRAAILEIMEDNVKVFYSDFAFVETVPMNSLRKLAKEFTEIGDGAIMCHLYGVTPAVGEEWPSLTKEFLKELLDAYQRIFITKTGSFKGKSMPVELWVYHTIQGGALEPNKSEWRCLNKKIIEQGLAIPDRSEEATLDTDTEKTGDNALAFLNMAGSVNDWLQIESLPSKPFQAIQDVRFQKPDPKAKYAKWTVGEPCIAQFYLDNKFHRARVVEVNDSSTCRVHFVDYVDGITPIDLKIDKLWMSDHLVDLGVAKYTDGSKTVVRKYAPSMKSPEPVDESDSGPDYIISKDDNFEKSSDFSLPGHGDSIEVQDWNKLMKDDDEDEDCEFVSYTPYNETEFECNVTVVNDVNTLELSIVWDHDKNLQYEKMFKELEEEGSNFNPLNGILANKACAAIFPDDGLWYRAAILQYSQVKGQVKVKYVDYGNIAVVSLADVREITDKYLQLPPATISAKLHDVTVNPAIDVSKVAEEYSKVFLDNGPFHAKVMQWDGDIPSVQLKINDELAYKSLYEKRIFLKKGNPEVKL